MYRTLGSIGRVLKFGLGGLGAGAIALALVACAPTASNQSDSNNTATGGISDNDAAGSDAAGNKAVVEDKAVGENQTAGGDGKLQVVTTFLPMTQFTQAVAGSCAEVSQILPSNVSPHDYQAKPTDAQRIAQADVLVQNGLELESFLEPMIENAGNPDLKIIEASAGLDLIAMAEEGHDHGHEEGHEEGHDHGHEEGHSHDHGEFDPHVWLDPQRAAAQVNVIRDGLIAAAPDCQTEFTANAAAYTDQLNALDEEIQQTLAPFAGKTFVTYHDFANYFAARYGLEVDFLVGVPEENPSPEDVKRVIETANSSELKTLLAESEVAARPFQALANDLGVEVSTFRPNETAGADGLAPDYYLTVMRENVANLAAAFGAQAE
ncbi:MAG: zinc ABC transporter solute-binding protein [Synechococcales cyanobacterium RM1_1_8]|nr:zinc ABC transporter solute-binding protein [Synechococcales cyanobacterium RM1_1_8]